MSAQLRPSTPWRFMPMHPAHLPEVVDIERRAYPFPWTDGIFRDCLRAGYGAWVAVGAGNRIWGYALMSMAVGEAHLLNLCTDSIWQRRGLGQAFLHHLIRLAREANCTIMLLEVRKSNEAARQLYESSGFVRVGVRRGYYPARGGREDALVFAYDIL